MGSKRWAVCFGKYACFGQSAFWMYACNGTFCSLPLEYIRAAGGQHLKCPVQWPLAPFLHLFWCAGLSASLTYITIELGLFLLSSFHSADLLLSSCVLFIVLSVRHRQLARLPGGSCGAFLWQTLVRWGPAVDRAIQMPALHSFLVFFFFLDTVLCWGSHVDGPSHFAQRVSTVHGKSLIVWRCISDWLMDVQNYNNRSRSKRIVWPCKAPFIFFKFILITVTFSVLLYLTPFSAWSIQVSGIMRCKKGHHHHHHCCYCTERCLLLFVATVVFSFCVCIKKKISVPVVKITGHASEK